MTTTTDAQAATQTIPLLLPDWAVGSGIGAYSSWRSGGVSTGPYADQQGGGGLNLGMHVGDQIQDVAENRRRFMQQLPGQPVWLNQVHGCDVAVYAKDSPLALHDAVISADAVVTDQPGVVCAIMTADCLPVLLCDQERRIVGALHAGWRGLAGGIVAQTMRRMQALGARKVSAWLGPAIGPDRFEVGPEVRTAFMQAAQRYAEHMADAEARSLAAFRASVLTPDMDRLLADIYQLAKIALNAAGVHDVSGGGLCTVSDPAFYSYRRDGVTGRMATAIWLRSAKQQSQQSGVL